MQVEIYDQNRKKPETSFGSKILSFIKAKPILFGLIVGGIVLSVALAIILPIVLSKKTNEEEIKDIDNKIDLSDGLPKYYDVKLIGNEKIIDFTDIKATADTKYTSINSKSQESGITYSSFCQYLGGLTYEGEREKVYLTYKWVIDNIAYDYDNYIHNTLQNVVYSPEDVFVRKETVCSGYSKLFRALLICMGYETSKIKNIQGHSKGASYNPDRVINDADTDHEWNAVQIGDKWCLIDSTWGAGSISTSGFNKKNSDYYLCTPAEQFVRSHIPKEREKDLQFLNNPIDLITFQKLASTSKNFFDYGFLGLAYDENIQNVCGRGRIVLKFDEIKSPKIIYDLVDPNGEEISDCINSKKFNNNYYYIDFLINEEGEYDIILYGKVDPSETSYWSFLKLIIKCDSPPNEKHSFPIFTEYYKDNLELISPMYRTLESGQKYNFKIMASGYNELFLNMLTSMDGTSYTKIPMDKDGDYFIKNDVVIYKGNLYIGYKDSNDDTTHNLATYAINSN